MSQDTNKISSLDRDTKSSPSNDGESTIDLPRNRFELELEFVQCLASPAYLHHLATSGLLSDSSFLSFLEYLRYWSRPEYARFITYPHCLYFLDLLTTNETFRREMANVAFRNFVHEQQFYSWQFRSRKLYGRGVPEEEKASAITGGEGGTEGSELDANRT
uniref:Mediator of RNA polymerase II transcription subunit 31 n=1 Tax=Odontella aurita TaxID=265563 RepID=A0A6U6IBL1_9STRA|mmetsp:Transcript_50949/g.153198  ORF Transcript_50949/g.153198 Transcript_50949/m.153198 type:complete len:161 (+) Transcript_50949:99-581(+)|eukprot:CAMPEP_0113528138 /NCGR_PEP_ID=MMETSP0015_2-20120614/1676_1 /TAXON_ID=2838 /ORGANISM="Odontella" /LENGTH=160 /DNA_ID=CAMNT_0000426633 /DNA_START=99 /DNA_END=581 /DNA_ORIENTATION=+ /assembly_acc=CAM_ASM_000160